MKIRKGHVIKISVVLAVVITGLFAFLKIYAGRHVPQHPKVGPVVEAVYALGTVKSDREYNLRLAMDAAIQRLYVKEGDGVRAGDRLLLTDSGITLRAPFAGVVSKINYREYEMANPNQVILTIVDDRSLYIQVSLDQQSVVMVRTGQDAGISFENLRQKSVAGRVERIYTSEGDFLVRIDSRDIPREVLPGMTCDVAIKIREREAALMVPASSVVNGRIILLRDGKRTETTVKTGAVNDDWLEVLDGSVRADDIIVSGKPGLPVKPNEDSGMPGPEM